MRTLDLVLRDVPLFEGLSNARRALIAGCAGNVRFLEGETLFREGDPANTFSAGPPRQHRDRDLRPGPGPDHDRDDRAGRGRRLVVAVCPYRWHFDARALSTVRATAFDGACLRGKCDEDPELGYELMSRFAQVLMERLQWTRLRLLDVYGDGRS